MVATTLKPENILEMYEILKEHSPLHFKFIQLLTLKDEITRPMVIKSMVLDRMADEQAQIIQQLKKNKK